MSESLARLTSKVFTEHRQSQFKVTSWDPPVELVLSSVEERQGPPSVETFSLLFTGPRHPQLPQRIHRLEHKKLGTLEIFLTPIGADQDGVSYEAVFNRLRKIDK